MNVFNEFPICILSPDVPFKIGLFAQMSCPSVKLKDTIIKICIPEPATIFNVKVLAYIKKQKQEIIDQIESFETKTFKVVSSAKDADFTFVINGIIRKHRGKLVKFPRIKWVMTKKSKKTERNGLRFIKSKQIKISPIEITRDHKPRRKVASMSEILEAPVFQTKAAYHLIFKNLVA